MNLRTRIYPLMWLLCILWGSVAAQTDYLGSITSVTLSNNAEYTFSSYTLTATGVTDTDPVLPTTSYSYVAAGSQGAVFFPPGTGTTNITTVTLTVGGTPYVLPATAFVGSATFVTPVAIARGQAVTLFVPNVLNPPFSSGCLNDPNVYDDGGGGQCDAAIYFSLENATGGGNYYHHYSSARYTIAKRSYFVRSVTVERTNTAAAPHGTTDNEMLTVSIYVGGSFGAFPVLNSLTLNTGSTTAVADILSASVWFTGGNKYFHAPGEALLGTFPNPAGNMVVPAASRTLARGNNFVWLAYDLRCDGTSIGHVLDGDLLSIVIDGISYFPSGPPSVRLIGQSYTAPTANLIPNPSFETFSTCPSILTQTFDNSIAKATGWNYLSPPTGGTADYFNACAAGGQADVPLNALGTQAAHTGNGYGGLVLDGRNNNFWEYMTAPLSATLQFDTTYYLSFYVSSADYFAGGNPIFKSNGLGAYFTSAPITVTNTQQLTAIPQFQYSPIIYDQQDWVHVFGTFIANGTENRITLGGFGTLLEDTIATSAYRLVTSTPGSYIYLDDFTLCKLSQVTRPCLGGPLAIANPSLHGLALPTGNKLTWQPAVGGQAERFEILAGKNGSDWSLLADVAGNAAMERFEYWDYERTSGATYYRVRQVNQDGSWAYSNVEVVMNTATGIAFRNPVQSQLRLTGLADDCPFRVYAIDGRTSLEGRTVDASIDLSGLNKGLYFLELQPQGQPRFVGRLLKE